MASVAARASLESLLRDIRDKRLDRTFITAAPLTGPRPADRLVPTNVAAIDTALDGGLPRGQISELSGAVSSGRTALLVRLLSEATRAGELVAIVDVLDQFDPVTAAAQGVVLERLLWIRGEGDQAVVRAIKALNLVVSAGGFGLVVFDAGGVSARALRQLPFTTWLRIQRVIEGSETACMLLADLPLARSSGGASVRLGKRPPASMASSVRLASAASDFHARVRASRYLGTLGTTGHERLAPDAAAASAHGVWRGAGPHARRFRGLTVRADVHYALRSASCEVVATEPRREGTIETRSTQRA
jgi:recA bacterial DNA recombination protein